MNPRKTRIIAIVVAGILVLAMVSALVLPYVLSASAAEDKSKKSVDNLKSQLEAIQQHKKDIEKDLQRLDGEMASEFARKAQLDEQIDVMVDEIRLMDDILLTRAEEIDQKDTEIIVLQADINKRYEMYAERVRISYEEGHMSYLEVLLGSEGFWDFFINLEVVGRIIEADNNLVLQLKEDKAQLESIRESIESDRAQQEEERAALQLAMSELEVKREESAGTIKRLEKNEANLEKEYEEADKAELELQKSIKKALEELARQKSVYVGGEFLWPLPGHYNITDPFGMRFHPILKRDKLHTGTDIGAPHGTKIVAANSGKVVKAETDSAYGKYVLIDHGGGYATLYAHMSSITVSEGQSVAQGDEVGKVGSTGWSTGNHLHFEIILNGDYKNPMDYFTKTSG